MYKKTILLPRDPSQIKRYTQTKNKGMEKDISCKWKEKSWGSSTCIRQNRLLIQDYIRDTEEHYIMIKGTIQQEDITVVNIYAPNTGAPKYVKQILMDIKGDIDRNTVIVGDFNTSLTTIEWSSRWKINKETVSLNSTPDQIN